MQIILHNISFVILKRTLKLKDLYTKEKVYCFKMLTKTIPAFCKPLPNTISHNC